MLMMVLVVTFLFLSLNLLLSLFPTQSGCIHAILIQLTSRKIHKVIIYSSVSCHHHYLISESYLSFSLSDFYDYYPYYTEKGCYFCRYINYFVRYLVFFATIVCGFLTTLLVNLCNRWHGTARGSGRSGGGF